MANAPKNRLEIQIIWDTGYWHVQGPVKGQTWTREELIAQLEKALDMCKSITHKEMGWPGRSTREWDSDATTRSRAPAVNPGVVNRVDGAVCKFADFCSGSEDAAGETAMTGDARSGDEQEEETTLPAMREAEL
jgi:hypothetical protein